MRDGFRAGPRIRSDTIRVYFLSFDGFTGHLSSSLPLPRSLQDVGQRRVGHVICQECGMLYTYGQPQDTVEHKKYHKKFTTGIIFHVSIICTFSGNNVCTSHISVIFKFIYDKMLIMASFPCEYSANQIIMFVGFSSFQGIVVYNG